MPDIENVTRPPVIPAAGAARILTDAVNVAHARGLTVSTRRDLGVVCVSIVEPSWQLDPRASAVSVLGALLLERQPPIVNIDQALSWVFGSRPEFHEGIEEGVAGVDGGGRSTDRLFAEGWFIGVQMRTLVSTVPCPTHLTRYPRGERCPRCAEGVPVERPAAETTRPLVLDTPRSLIAGLLASLTPSQVLEAVADDFHARRAGPLGAHEADSFDMVESMLRELATDMSSDDGDEG